MDGRGVACAQPSRKNRDFRVFENLSPAELRGELGPKNCMPGMVISFISWIWLQIAVSRDGVRPRWKSRKIVTLEIFRALSRVSEKNCMRLLENFMLSNFAFGLKV